MPVIKQAEKKLRRDRRRTAQNARARRKLRTAVKAMRQKPSAKALAAAFKTLDKATKTHLIHRGRAARLKSRLTKLLKKK
ncbi:MAG: 30S ribosomal protein S20 [Patescibacteria group bacterium]